MGQTDLTQRKPHAGRKTSLSRPQYEGIGSDCAIQLLQPTKAGVDLVHALYAKRCRRRSEGVESSVMQQRQGWNVVSEGQECRGMW